MTRHDLEKRLLTALADDGSVSITDLAGQLDAHPVTVDRCCHDLESDGYVRHHGGGRYSLTDVGHRELVTGCDD